MDGACNSVRSFPAEKRGEVADDEITKTRVL